MHYKVLDENLFSNSYKYSSDEIKWINNNQDLIQKLLNSVTITPTQYKLLHIRARKLFNQNFKVSISKTIDEKNYQLCYDKIKEKKKLEVKEALKWLIPVCFCGLDRIRNVIAETKEEKKTYIRNFKSVFFPTKKYLSDSFVLQQLKSKNYEEFEILSKLIDSTKQNEIYFALLDNELELFLKTSEFPYLQNSMNLYKTIFKHKIGQKAKVSTYKEALGGFYSRHPFCPISNYIKRYELEESIYYTTKYCLEQNFNDMILFTFTGLNVKSISSDYINSFNLALSRTLDSKEKIIIGISQEELNTWSKQKKTNYRKQFGVKVKDVFEGYFAVDEDKFHEKGSVFKDKKGNIYKEGRRKTNEHHFHQHLLALVKKGFKKGYIPQSEIRRVWAKQCNLTENKELIGSYIVDVELINPFYAYNQKTGTSKRFKTKQQREQFILNSESEVRTYWKTEDKDEIKETLNYILKYFGKLEFNFNKKLHYLGYQEYRLATKNKKHFKSGGLLSRNNLKNMHTYKNILDTTESYLTPQTPSDKFKQKNHKKYLFGGSEPRNIKAIGLNKESIWLGYIFSGLNIPKYVNILSGCNNPTKIRQKKSSFFNEVKTSLYTKKKRICPFSLEKLEFSGTKEKEYQTDISDVFFQYKALNRLGSLFKVSSILKNKSKSMTFLDELYLINNYSPTDKIAWSNNEESYNDYCTENSNILLSESQTQLTI